MAGSTASARLGWAVHAFTATGAALGLLALWELTRGGLEAAALYMLAALAIDSVDGSLARRADVATHVPRIDGRRLDDVVDYLNFAVVPLVFLLQLEVLWHWSLAAGAVMASAYGFAQRDAKTADDFFLGWPSYWNVVALYVWKLELPSAAASAGVAVCAALIFVPLPYVYPSKLRRFRTLTVLGGVAWAATMAAAVYWPEAARRQCWVEISLLYPAWYVALSAWLGGWLRGGLR